MSVETPALAERLKTSPEATRSFGKRSNDGKRPIHVHPADVEHKPLPTRSPHAWRGGMRKAVKRQHIKRTRRELARLMLTAG